MSEEIRNEGYENSDIQLEGLTEKEAREFKPLFTKFIKAYAKKEDGVLKTSGGRVAGAVAVADTLEEAIEKAYKITEEIKFENKYVRTDIGRKVLGKK